MIEATTMAVRDEVGQAYVKKCFPAEAKAACKEMIDYIVKAFEESIKTREWMEDVTKEKALKKLSSLLIGVKYKTRFEKKSKKRFYLNRGNGLIVLIAFTTLPFRFKKIIFSLTYGSSQRASSLFKSLLQ